MKTIILAAFLLVLALVAVQAMPEESHRLRGQGAGIHNDHSTSTPPRSGGGGMCWSSSTCVDNCKRTGFNSGYCFFFNCYCTDQKA